MARKKNRKKRFRIRNLFFSALISLLVGAAIRDQLSRPPEERTWHGDIAGIPYDFRIPTVEKMRTAMWNPNDARLLVPQAFGVGWTVNFYRLLHPEMQQSLQPESVR
jgi:Family of unknown function (DUF5808)